MSASRPRDRRSRSRAGGRSRVPMDRGHIVPDIPGIGPHRWFRHWCQALVVHHGREKFADAVKRGGPMAFRLAVLYAYGAPMPEGAEEHATERLAALTDHTPPPDLDTSRAEVAVRPAPPPRGRTPEEAAEDAEAHNRRTTARRAKRSLTPPGSDLRCPQCPPLDGLSTAGSRDRGPGVSYAFPGSRNATGAILARPWRLWGATWAFAACLWRACWDCRIEPEKTASPPG